jgi:hypothetical protein
MWPFLWLLLQVFPQLGQVLLFLENVTRAWKVRDGRAYSAEFWPDAEIVNVFGGVLSGG